jgi:uncharacterized protein with PQ loop repeat
MTPIEILFQNLLNLDVWGVVKLLLIFALSIYLVFAFMVIREVDAMLETLKGVFNLPIKLVAWLHFLFSILVLILAIIVL